jgi:hypothetical protein
MKNQILYINNRGKYCLYGLCLFLIFLLSLTYSFNVTAQANYWDYLGNLPYFSNYNLVYDPTVYSLNIDSSTLMAPMFTSDQGRSGFQAQAPLGVQVLSARGRHMLYSFWARPDQDPFAPSYYQFYTDPYLPSTDPSNPPIPFIGKPYWHPTANKPYWHPTVNNPIGPSMFHGKTYWKDQASSFSEPPAIGPSMFYDTIYWSPNLGGMALGF